MRSKLVKRRCRRLTAMLVFQFVILQSLFAQTLSMSGSTCVLAGGQYTYALSGSSSIYSLKTTWTITGGKIAGTANTTTVTQTPMPSINVEWDATSTGSVYATVYNADNSIFGSASKNVTKYNALTPGTLSNLSQTIAYNTIPATINSASAASAGYCTPTYSYQWQQSTDNSNFTNITGATSLSLGFSAPLTATTYYRRMVTETNSSSSAYTSTATVNVTSTALNGGCITSADQTIGSGTIPSTITASAATSGSCSGSHQYQWQSSPDSIYFTNIPGATSQNLTFSTGITQTMYYQRRTICGSETRYTGRSKVTIGQLSLLRPRTQLWFAQMPVNEKGVQPGSLYSFSCYAGIARSTFAVWRKPRRTPGLWLYGQERNINRS